MIMNEELISIFNDASSLIEEAQKLLNNASRIRSSAVIALHNQKLTQKEIGELLGISPQRVSQLMTKEAFQKNNDRILAMGPTHATHPSHVPN